jgi:hypothetical protein
MSDDDPLVQKSEKQEEVSGAKEAQAANLFDLRRIIGGLLIVYGVVLTILGIFDSDAEVAKAAGLRINLWAGLGMLIVGVLFVVWSLTRPLSEELAAAERD